jgi:hypothetical protein
MNTLRESKSHHIRLRLKLVTRTRLCVSRFQLASCGVSCEASLLTRLVTQGHVRITYFRRNTLFGDFAGQIGQWLYRRSLNLLI